MRRFERAKNPQRRNAETMERCGPLITTTAINLTPDQVCFSIKYAGRETDQSTCFSLIRPNALTLEGWFTPDSFALGIVV